MRTADTFQSAFLRQPEQPESTLQYSAHNEIIKQPLFYNSQCPLFTAS